MLVLISWRSLMRGSNLRSHHHWLAVIAVLHSAASWAQSSASPYTVGIRYDVAQRVVGIIAPDPDGAAGTLKYAATRNTYDSRGLLTVVEIGELSSWYSEGTLPQNWSGFTVFVRADYTYEIFGKKLSEQTSSGGVSSTLRQFSYDSVGRRDCTAERMNVGAFTADLAILREADAGVKVAELARKNGISPATFYQWKSKYGGLDVSQLRRLRELETENARLKKMYAELS